jgi:hypothetical protein
MVTKFCLVTELLKTHSLLCNDKQSRNSAKYIFILPPSIQEINNCGTENTAVQIVRPSAHFTSHKNDEGANVAECVEKV